VSEMTEEEMIDLALRLSEQEASIVAIRRQKEEEEAMMKAIQDSVSTKWLTLKESQSAGGKRSAGRPKAPAARRCTTTGGSRSVPEDADDDCHVCPGTEAPLLESNSEGGVSDGGKGEEEAELDVETGPGETGDGAQRRSSSPELDPAREASVDCPICQRSFPLAEIEVHAAYCDDFFLSLKAPLKPRRKRTRKTGEEEAAESSSTASNREKCYICRALVPLRDYSRHTELCIQQQDAKVLRADRPIPASRSHKITAALTFQRENLLSALDKTESRDSGESQRRFPPKSQTRRIQTPAGVRRDKTRLTRDIQAPNASQTRRLCSRLRCVIDLLNDDDVEEVHEEGGVRVSNSPIRSFTPISQATDCLIDFRKQQRSRKARTRGGRTAGRRRAP
uniref:BRCA1-A complex subunit RAP80 n=1 Tax=Tetraodon nigroviridis TaxID=99883 RepID=H3BWQ2_TETNG